jgi:ESCRT-I complex subunit VPS37
LDDEDTFNAFVTQSDLYQRWESDKEVEMASNKSLAEYNLSLEPKLIEGKERLKELYEKVGGMVTEVATKRAMLDSSTSRTSLDTTYALLQAASAEADEKSEELSETFLTGAIDLETFTHTFIPLRISAHLRRLKSEKMAEIIASHRQRSSSAPYPSGPQMMMPMPGMGIPGLPR